MTWNTYTAEQFLRKLQRGAQVAEIIESGSVRKTGKVLVRFTDGEVAQTTWDAAMEAMREDTAAPPT